jgi:gliding motility-associated lipoprotein GldH
MLKRNLFTVWCLAGLLLVLSGCRQTALYERLANIPGARWDQGFVPTYSFQIADTTSYYRIYVVIRHTNRYAYRNIWLNAGMQHPADTMRVQQFELALASGEKWLGVGMDDVYERRIQLFPNPVKFARSGTLVMSLQHTMRINPLPEVLQAGIRVEPVAQIP